MMKHWIPLSAVAALTIALAAVRPGDPVDAQEKAKPQKPAAAKSAGEEKEAAAAKRKEARGRLPNYYGQVGVSDEQREKIYAVQKKFAPQIEELQKQIMELQAQREAEMEAVLTDAQKEQLTKLREDAKKQAIEKKKAAAEKATASTAKPGEADEK